MGPKNVSGSTIGEYLPFSPLPCSLNSCIFMITAWAARWRPRRWICSPLGLWCHSGPCKGQGRGQESPPGKDAEAWRSGERKRSTLLCHANLSEDLGDPLLREGEMGFLALWILPSVPACEMKSGSHARKGCPSTHAYPPQPPGQRTRVQQLQSQPTGLGR